MALCRLRQVGALPTLSQLWRPTAQRLGLVLFFFKKAKAAPCLPETLSRAEPRQSPRAPPPQDTETLKGFDCLGSACAQWTPAPPGTGAQPTPPGQAAVTAPTRPPTCLAAGWSGFLAAPGIRSS